MNLERIEQRCLEFIGKSQHPFVPFSELLEHVREDPGTAEIERNDLLAFLRNHELFKIIDPICLPNEESTNTDILSWFQEPAVALCTRIPSHHEMHELMLQQVDTIITALEHALEEDDDLPPDKTANVAAVLEKAYRLREKLISFRE